MSTDAAVYNTTSAQGQIFTGTVAKVSITFLLVSFNTSSASHSHTDNTHFPCTGRTRNWTACLLYKCYDSLCNGGYTGPIHNHRDIAHIHVPQPVLYHRTIGCWNTALSWMCRYTVSLNCLTDSNPRILTFRSGYNLSTGCPGLESGLIHSTGSICTRNRLWSYWSLP